MSFDRHLRASRSGPAPLALALLATAGGAHAAWPPPPDAGASAYADPSNWPSDPGYADQWQLFGFTPAPLAAVLPPAEAALGVGASVDRAWSLTRGDPRVTIALLNAGVHWGEPDLADRFALSRGELPLPQDAAGQVSTGADPWDRNGDGRFSVRDYTSATASEPPTPDRALDPRLSARPDRGDLNGNGLLDAQDLIALFSNGLDEDQNGYVDDICGWDFAWDDNDPFDDVPAGGVGRSPGSQDALEAVAQADNGVGIAGACPDCAALPLRVGAALLTDPTRIAAALDYALGAGARVAALPAQALGSGAVLQAALDRAWAGGLAVIAAPAGERGLRHDAPANLERVFLVRPAGFEGASWQAASTFFAADSCGSPGGHTSAAAPSVRCGPGAAALGAGVAGLLHSAALAAGLTPPLSAGEVHQLLATQADTLVPGWSPLLGHGRLNARRAVEAIEAGRVPAAADLVEPRWFAGLPAATPFPVVASVEARAPFTLTLEAAGGPNPGEASFVTFAQLDRASAWKGVAGTIDPSRLTLPPPRPEADPHSFAITVRLRVVTHFGGAVGDVASELRKTVFLRPPDEQLPGYPVLVPGVGAGSPRLIDLDGDGSDELVVASVDGLVHVLGARGDERPGFPVRVGPSRLFAAHPRADAGVPAQAIAASPAFEDLDDDGRLEVIVATFEGALHAFDVEGKPMAGFPVALGEGATLPCFAAAVTGCRPSGYADGGAAGLALRDLERGALASPVVMTTPAGPIVVQAGLDGFLHGFRANGQGAPGFPIELPDAAPARSRLIATPAVADLDGDGWPEIAAATTGVTAAGGARAYLFAGGPDGPALVANWPIELEGTAAAAVLGRGAVASPLIADVDADGRPELALQAAGGPLRLFDSKGEVVLELAGSLGAGPAVNPSAADLDADGLLEIVSADVGADGAARLLVWHAGRHLRERQGNATTPVPLASGFPVGLQGSEALSGFGIADIDGDGLPEILSGAGYLAMAVNGFGQQPAGWPKFTGGTLASTPAIGLVAGDLAVAAATREGWVFLYRGYGFPQRIAWDGFHHDPRNTGYAAAPLPLRNLPSIGVPNPKLRPPGCCSGAPGPAELWAATLLLGWLSTRRAKTDS